MPEDFVANNVCIQNVLRIQIPQENLRLKLIGRGDAFVSGQVRRLKVRNIIPVEGGNPPKYAKRTQLVTENYQVEISAGEFPAVPKILRKQLPTKVLPGNLNPWQNPCFLQEIPEENREFLTLKIVISWIL
ncbi:hypothetical protein MTR_4g091160 [Medicago truncatula]|uniref:Uncharacterized protein n=1 Tax=Medicago truncatula TaxID=3880 RepID=G7JRU5_MEDTR|nr:hypothetical protein MTR_4g091160 [Medicago truncatula]